MPNQFLSDEFGDIEDYFVTDYRLIDQFVGDQLWIWGLNSSGQLGINDTTQRLTPVTTFAGGTNWKQVSSWSYTAAIKTDGSLWVWGSGGSGQLGNNDTTDTSTPVTTFAGGNDWKQVSAGFFRTAAIKTDGSLWVWGNNSNFRLGDGTGTTRSIPVEITGGGTNWKQVSSGRDHMGAIKTDGTLWMWGSTSAGALGTLNDPTVAGPVTTFAGGTDWKQISCGFAFTAAIKTDGSLWVWGANGSGQLGVNDTTNRNTPVTTFTGGNDWKQVSCATNNSTSTMSAIKTDGSLWLWGRGTEGQLGINSSTNRSTPITTFAGGTNWKSVHSGGYSTFAIKTDGTLWTWGINFNGLLGINNTSIKNTPVTTFAGGNNWKQVSGSNPTSAVKSGFNVDLS